MNPHLSFVAPSLVVLCGPSGAGKSRFAERLFQPNEILSLERTRALVSDDERDQSMNRESIDVIRTIARARLRAGRLTVIDSPALLARERGALLQVAQDVGVPAQLLVFDADRRTCLRNNQARNHLLPDRVLDRQLQRLAETKQSLYRDRSLEGFSAIHVLKQDEANAIKSVSRVTHPARQLDIIGDPHGCAVELKQLLGELGYLADEIGTYKHPAGRLAVFVGDLVDRGPASLEVLSLVDRMVAAGSALMGALGNHDWKLYRALVENQPVIVSEALQTTLDEIERAEAVTAGARQRVIQTIGRLFSQAPTHSVYDHGQLVVTHGAILAGTQGRRTSSSRRDPVSTLNIFGQVASEREENGRPIRIYDWVDQWPQEYTVVFGHEIVGPRPRTLGAGNVVALDTGCVHGGRLTALRWPEREFVSMSAIRLHSVDESEHALDGVALDPLGVERLTLAEVQAASRQRPPLRLVADTGA